MSLSGLKQQCNIINKISKQDTGCPVLRTGMRWVKESFKLSPHIQVSGPTKFAMLHKFVCTTVNVTEHTFFIIMPPL